MLAAQRRDELLERLRAHGRVVAKEVAAELGTTEDTIRRDLRELAAAGLCQRVYGGALPASPAVADLGARAGLAPTGKRAVAAAAVRLLPAGGTVLLDGGSTALAVARALPPALDVTVVTHSPVVAAALVTHPRAEVLVLGGRLFKHSGVTCGAATVEAAARVHADVFLLGVTGVHPDAGLTTGDAEEAALKRALAARAAETYVLASSEKVGTASTHVVLPLAEVAGVVTDAPPHDPVVAALGAAGHRVLHA
ncbi:DeoR/GlpR family DNA-binding transcription regulator [Kineococcus auxinigenes]|uniref:DeoR/GlpR family DNA-binding transcription regulator n=1 Tax=unclassified Kineococcus TaxID=2621656 RepID=UPI003D7E9D48